ncbi:hypothetical protein ACFWZT_29455 [Streptomyces alboflavus]|uniref:hypothetical protein n=1 Tax=Streptomyces alboflavus TaxID=67267 RepID=UPI0036B65030
MDVVHGGNHGNAERRPEAETEILLAQYLTGRQIAGVVGAAGLSGATTTSEGSPVSGGRDRSGRPVSATRRERTLLDHWTSERVRRAIGEQMSVRGCSGPLHDRERQEFCQGLIEPTVLSVNM